MRKYGFKLFSTNLQNNPAFIDEAAAFVRANNREMFIELMVVADNAGGRLGRFPR